MGVTTIDFLNPSLHHSLFIVTPHGSLVNQRINWMANITMNVENFLTKHGKNADPRVLTVIDLDLEVRKR